MPSDTPEALNAELLARNVELKRRIGELQVKLARHQVDKEGFILTTIRANARNAEMNDREFREFVRRLV